MDVPDSDHQGAAHQGAAPADPRSPDEQLEAAAARLRDTTQAAVASLRRQAAGLTRHHRGDSRPGSGPPQDLSPEPT